MSTSNIHVIISGTTAIVRVQLVDPWATNNTFNGLNWTSLVNWYALKIRPRNSKIEQQFQLNRCFMPMAYSRIECSLSRTFKWRNKDSLYHGTAFSNQVCVFCFCFFFNGKNNIWRAPRDFLGKRVSVLSIFFATAYDILRFSTISEIKK